LKIHIRPDSHDFNDKLDGQSLADVRDGWEDEPIMMEWTKYAQTQMGIKSFSYLAFINAYPFAGDNADTDEQDPQQPSRKKKEPPFQLEFDDDGTPILPDPDADDGMAVGPMCQAIRQFLTAHYRGSLFLLQYSHVSHPSSAELSSGNKKASVPWGFLLGKETEYVDSEYLPEGFAFKEPSKVTKAVTREWLKFWFGRQEDPQTATVFAFKGVKGKNGEPVHAAGSGIKGTSTRKGGRKPKPPTKKNGKNSKKTAAAADESADDDEDRTSSTTESESQDDDDDDDAEKTDDRQQEPVGPLPLPFAPVAKSYLVASGQTSKAPPKSRYRPNTGPQFEDRQTRHRKRTKETEDDDNQVNKKRRVEKRGPPVGIPKNKNTRSRGKGKARQ
jgi:hypothetical protein